MGKVRFRGRVELGGKTATGFVVPAAVVERLGSGRRPAVRVTINGYTYRSTVASMGGQFMVGVSAEHRGPAGVAAGDEVDIDLELDTEPRAVEVPSDLAGALGRDEVAGRFFAGLSYTHQRWYVLWIESAKKAETRERRVVKAVAMLREGRKQG
jgi:hypothetical protein